MFHHGSNEAFTSFHFFRQMQQTTLFHSYFCTATLYDVKWEFRHVERLVGNIGGKKWCRSWRPVQLNAAL